jgi:protein gp37
MSTGISYADETWNPIKGCKPVSEGCLNCYAAAFASRELCPSHMGLTTRSVVDGPQWNGNVCTMLGTPTMTQPLRWKKPRTVLVPSMGDLFYHPEGIPDGELVSGTFDIMKRAKDHTFLFLTKRLAGYGHAYLLRRPVLPNVLIGVTVENQRRAYERLPLLAELAAAGWRTWVSVEPLLGRINMRVVPANCDLGDDDYFCALTGAGYDPQAAEWGGKYSSPAGTYGSVEFVAVGGESGPGARFCDINWIGSVISQCAQASTKLHVKQLGTNSNWPKGWKLKSRTRGNPDEWADYMKWRDMP